VLTDTATVPAHAWKTMFDARVDGVVAGERGLRGKPAPDTFLAAAELGTEPAGEGRVE
jgi:beta-phosphoglucomutase-like phosphatase (HAD superfamily)